MQRQPVSCAWPCDLWPRTRLGRPPGKRLADSTVSSGVCFNVTHQKAHRQVFRVCLQVAPHEPEQRTGSMGLRIQSSSGRSQCPCRQRLRPDRFSCRRQLLHFLHQLNRAQVLPLKKKHPSRLGTRTDCPAPRTSTRGPAHGTSASLHDQVLLLQFGRRGWEQLLFLSGQFRKQSQS